MFLNKVKKIYKGNICLDTGSIMGSLSLYPRSIQILESGEIQEYVCAVSECVRVTRMIWCSLSLAK